MENSRLEEEKKAAALLADNAEVKHPSSSRDVCAFVSALNSRISGERWGSAADPTFGPFPVSSTLQRESKKKISESKQFQEYKRILKNKSEELKKARDDAAARCAPQQLRSPEHHDCPRTGISDSHLTRCSTRQNCSAARRSAFD